ncbi:MAG: mannose-1-phosphate guanylyltransferase [Bacteroidales bacterium]|nr:mannose-1-phosphate guanylyltransferase [Bacteroidales bacterium]
MENFCIIMAGGIGSRFWPLSKDNYPKQFLDILGTGKSFIRSTYDRFSPVIPDENFLVVTNKAYKQLVLEQLPMLRPDQVLCEPARRNTAPCIAYACYHIQSRCKDANIVVTPADHLVTNEREFERIIRLGFDFLAQNQQALMTIGIKPSRPETGYGYIQVGASDRQGSLSRNNVIPVLRFKEKPDYDTAVKFVADGNFFWNSGIFLWTLDGIMSAFRQYLPEMVEVFEKGIYNFGTPEEQDFINDHFVDCPNISIDYGVMEKSPNTYTIPADFGWSDIGTWGSLFTHAQKDEAGNAIRGKVVAVDNKNTIINIEDGTEAVVEGLEDYLVAYRDHSLLVCKLHDEQQIKIWIEGLK